MDCLTLGTGTVEWVRICMLRRFRPVAPPQLQLYTKSKFPRMGERASSAAMQATSTPSWEGLVPLQMGTQLQHHMAEYLDCLSVLCTSASFSDSSVQ